jgi:hypothetical protein
MAALAATATVIVRAMGAPEPHRGQGKNQEKLFWQKPGENVDKLECFNNEKYFFLLFKTH